MEKYEIPEKVRKECKERLSVAKTNLMLNAPFFGIIIGKMNFIPDNPRVKTLATDGRNLYYNIEFIMGIQHPEKRQWYEDELKSVISDLTPDQINDALNGLSDLNLIAALCHEVLHCAYNHFLRRGNRNPKKWNRAADYAINQMIKRDSKLGKIRDSWLYDVKFDGMSAEQIYNMLPDKTGDGAGGGGTLDQHEFFDFESEEEREEFEQNMEYFKEQMFGAAMAGGAPADIVRRLEELKESKIDWRTKIIRTMQSLIKNDLSYSRPSRRTWSYGMMYGQYSTPIMPGLVPDNDIDVCVAIDASGSISTRMLADFLSEVVGMAKQHTQFKIRILTFSTSVCEVQDYSTGDEEKMLEYKIRGGGGTSFTCVWDYMKEQEYKPKQLIMFTDGEPYPSNAWGDESYCDTLFVIHSNPKKKAPFGSTVYYEEEIASNK